MSRLLDLPFLVLLMGVGAAAMYLPALHALILGEHAVGRAFLYPATLFLVLTSFVALATARQKPLSQVVSLLGAYALLPLMLAVPLVEAVPGIRFFDAWFEMVSSFTTTGATLFDAPAAVPAPVHLWRALVGWLGGFFVLLTVFAILAPRNLGGFEVISGRPGRRGDGRKVLRPGRGAGNRRVVLFAVALAPVYGGLTALLAVLLLVAGEAPLVATVHAMSILATSGISPVAGSGASGPAGEVLMLGFMAFALSRRSLPGGVQPGETRSLRVDPEIRLALWLIAVVGLVLFARHFLGAMARGAETDWPAALGVLWGSLFTAGSFLSTTGFAAEQWTGAQDWSGLGPSGLVLAGLALVGGGIATTAGGLKLLRVFALYRHGSREMERILHPSLVSGRGPRARRLRRAGALAAWVYFMLFVMSLVGIVALLAACGLAFEPALVFAISALSTTGPLATFATEVPLSYAALGDAPRLVLAAAMVLGRVELLALIALLMPESWRG